MCTAANASSHAQKAGLKEREDAKNQPKTACQYLQRRSAADLFNLAVHVRNASHNLNKQLSVGLRGQLWVSCLGSHEGPTQPSQARNEARAVGH